MAAKKYLKFDPTTKIHAEESSVDSSAGAGDAGKITALNASGVLAASILNGVTSSAGAGDSGKTGLLDASGKWDSSMMPTGIGADTQVIVTSENLSAGNLVNIYNNAGTVTARKADATTVGKLADGFVLAATTSGQNATVYGVGTNTGVTGLVGGDVYLDTTAGGVTQTAPSGSGNIVQRVGFASAAGELWFQRGTPTALA